MLLRRSITSIKHKTQLLSASVPELHNVQRATETLKLMGASIAFTGSAVIVGSGIATLFTFRTVSLATVGATSVAVLVGGGRQ